MPSIYSNVTTVMMLKESDSGAVKVTTVAIPKITAHAAKPYENFRLLLRIEIIFGIALINFFILLI